MASVYRNGGGHKGCPVPLNRPSCPFTLPGTSRQLWHRGMVCWSPACALPEVRFSLVSSMLWTKILLAVSNRGTARGGVRLVGWGAIYWFFGLMFGVGTYQKYTQHIGVFVTAKSLRGCRLLRLLLRPPDSYFRHVHVCRGAFFHVKLDYISDDTRPPIPGTLGRRKPQEDLRVQVGSTQSGLSPSLSRLGVALGT